MRAFARFFSAFSASLLFAAGCAGADADSRGAQVACATGTDSDGNACEARQPAAITGRTRSAAATTPPELARLLTPPDDARGDDVARLSADKMYETAWTFQAQNDFERARLIYRDIVDTFPSTPRAIAARFELGEMYLAEGLAFGAYLGDAADAFAAVADDSQADPELAAFALMRLEETSELTGDAAREAASKERLERDFPKSDAAKALSAKTSR